MSLGTAPADRLSHPALAQALDEPLHDTYNVLHYDTLHHYMMHYCQEAKWLSTPIEAVPDYSRCLST